MDEDEQLCRAIAASLQDMHTSTPSHSSSSTMTLIRSKHCGTVCVDLLHCGSKHCLNTVLLATQTHYSLVASKCSKCAMRMVEYDKLTPPIAPPKARSIIIHPTSGSFTRYRQDCLLHVGITNSTGDRVYNFDERSTSIDRANSSRWDLSISTAIEHDISDNEWDQVLQVHHRLESDRAKQRGFGYHTLNNNCYSYVIRFLELLRFEGSDSHSKNDIVERFISHPVEVCVCVCGNMYMNHVE
jgi:hypothetical protein